MESATRWSVSAPWDFRGTRYTISADVRKDFLLVQVEEDRNADQWRAQFEAKREERAQGVCLLVGAYWGAILICAVLHFGARRFGRRQTCIIGHLEYTGTCTMMLLLFTCRH